MIEVVTYYNFKSEANHEQPCLSRYNPIKYIVILIGNCKVGKTSLLNFLTQRKSNQKDPTPTIGVEYAPLNLRVGINDIRVNIWDTCNKIP